MKAQNNTMEFKNKKNKSNIKQIGDTVFTVNHIQSDNAKKDINSIIKGLILNNLNTNIS